jgi:hypothetical protein
MDHRVPPTSTIQAVIDVAQPGDRVIIPQGTWYERLCLQTPGITLEGEPGATVHGGDLVPAWTQAPEVGAGVWKTTSIPYQPWALTVQGQAIWRINNDTMNGQAVYGTNGNGWYYLTRPATGAYTGNVGYTVPSYWDGIEALFGYKSPTTYVRFRHGDDPNAHGLRSAPAGGTVLIDNACGVTIRGLTILGGEQQIWLRGDGAHHTLIDQCRLTTGRRRVLLSEGAHHNTIQRCTMTCAAVGFAPVAPGEWERNTADATLTVKTHLYNENKFCVGRTTEDDTGVYLNGGDGNRVTQCHLAWGLVGVAVWHGQATRIDHCRIEGMGAQGLWLLQGAASAQMDHNQFADSEHHVRIQDVEQAPKRTYVFCHNTCWQPRPESQSSKHLHASFLVDEQDTATYTSPVELWAYHNSFAGGGWALDVGATNRQMPGFRAVNNLLSSRGMGSTGGTPAGTYAYNWIRTTSLGVGDVEEGNVTGDGTRLFADQAEPDFVIPAGPYGDTARSGALDLSQPFTIDGTTYAPLPEMPAPLDAFGAPVPLALAPAPVPPDPEEPGMGPTYHVATLVHALTPGTYTVRVQVLEDGEAIAENTSVPWTVPSGDAPPVTVDVPVVTEEPPHA